MENVRFLECLDSDYRRIRGVVPGHLSASVPTCPGWDVAALVRHVGEVYLHKVECMRAGGPLETPWPPAGLLDEEPVALLDRAYSALTAEFIGRDPGDLGGGFYDPDPTVGFWIRRMAQESVIHRVDAELGAGVAVSPVPDDLAVDGVDELLRVFIGWAFGKWPGDFAEALKDSPGYAILIQAGAPADSPGGSWLVQMAPDRLTVAGGPGEHLPDSVRPDVTVGGAPADVLRWGWNRETPGAASPLRIAGNAEALIEFRQCLVAGTQ
jgi:uncharacterized protein (TIGR03083 family)